MYMQAMQNNQDKSNNFQKLIVVFAPVIKSLIFRNHLIQIFTV